MYSILVLNLGSTSFKFKCYRMGETEELMASGSVERIGGNGSFFVSAGDQTLRGECACPTHADALDLCLAKMETLGVSVDMSTLDALGYKAVHGGMISGTRMVDDALLSQMERMAPLAPAHNPVYTAMMRSIRVRYPDVAQIACFETAFHSSMPQERAVYGVPYEWAREYGIRRYGFHGSSHGYIASKMAREAPGARRVISAHLGGSCSLCAIMDGKSIASSMGATPQSGLFHNNRVGDFDVFALPALVEAMGGLEAVLHALSTQSGLFGLSGVSNDIRDVESAADAGNARAQLALDAFADEIAGYVGMYTAYLGGLDALCFTGGIGLKDARIRAAAVHRLGFLNARLDDDANARGMQGRISASDSAISIWVWETNEEIMVARGCAKLLSQ